jgi:hypothetical protein
MNDEHGSGGTVMGASQARPLGVLGAVRAFGVMLGVDRDLRSAFDLGTERAVGMLRTDRVPPLV